MTGVIMPVNFETWEEHFTLRGWSTIQDQIDAGYPYFLQPTAATGRYFQIHDLGALISSSLITLVVQTEAIVGNVTLTPTISYSPDNSTWTSGDIGAYSTFATNFRYIKIQIDGVPDADTDFVRLVQIRVRVSIKTARDGGHADALASDDDPDPDNGTQVFFNKTFVDVQSITVTPDYQAAEAAGISAVVNFNDDPNPTYFRVLLYSNDTGDRIDGGFNWSCQGIQ